MTKEEKNWAALSHIASFAGFFIPFGNIVGPLLVWVLKKEDSSYVDFHGKEALNFQISVTIYFLIASALVILLIGIPLLLLVFLFSFIFPVIAAIRASEGVYYYYPFSIRLIN